MRMVDLIAKKRNGGRYRREEIEYIVQAYTNGTIPDYQMAAWLMAVYFQGMSAEETAWLTLAMAASGEQLDLSAIPGFKVDKHSTGGVGDKTTLVVAPLVAAAGIPVAKMSGRGLGHSGGTIDKLEAIPGFQVELGREQFLRQVREVGVAVIGQSGNLAPADKKVYALRDVTATVESVPLIASSIMSKKIAAGADAILLDVKVGRGAFMKTAEEAEQLARAMVEIGEQVKRRTVAVITDMNQPLGFAVGNALEVEEAVATLAGKGPADLTELSLTLGAHMLLLGGIYSQFADAYGHLSELIRNGKALEKFFAMVAAQGGDASVLEHPERLPQAKRKIDVTAARAGYIAAIDAEQVGHACVLLGAGRATKDSPVDPAVGVRLFRKAGDKVNQGDVLARIHANDLSAVDRAKQEVEAAFRISDQPSAPPPLIYKTVSL